MIKIAPRIVAQVAPIVIIRYFVICYIIRIVAQVAPIVIIRYFVTCYIIRIVAPVAPREVEGRDAAATSIESEATWQEGL